MNIQFKNRFLFLVLAISIPLGLTYGQQTTSTDNADATQVTQAAESGGTINIGNLGFIKGLPLPSGVKNFLSKISITKPSIQNNVPIKRNPTSPISPTDKATIISGSATISSVTLGVKIRILNLQGGGTRLSVIVGLPNGIKLSSIDSGLGAFDTLSLQEAAFIFAQGDPNTESYYDPDWKLQVIPGFTLAATVAVKGQINTLLQQVGWSGANITVSGTIYPDLAGSFISASLGNKVVNLGEGGKMGQATGLTLTLALEETAPGVPAIDISIKAGFQVKIPGQTAPVSLFGEFRAEFGAGAKLFISGWMEGCFDNVFGIKGLSIGQLGVRADMDLGLLATTGLPISGFAVQGAIGFGGAQSCIPLGTSTPPGVTTLFLLGAVDFAPEAPQFTLVGTLDNLYLSDIVNLGATILKKATKIDISGIAKGLPEIGFKEIKVYIVPATTQIAGKTYQKGVEVDVTADILGVETGLDVRVDDSGINAEGYLNQFTVGPLTITGVGPDRVAGTADDAAVIQLVVDPKKLLAQFFLDATVKLDILGGISAATTIDLSSKGLSLRVDISLFNEFEAIVQISANGAVSPSAAASQAEQQAAAAAGTAAAQTAEQAAETAAAQAVGTTTGESVEASLQAATTAAGAGGTQNLGQDTSYGVYVLFKQDALAKWSKACSDAAQKMMAKANKTLNKDKAKCDNLDKQIADLDKKISDLKAQDAQLNQENKNNVAKAQQTIAPLNASKAQLDAAVAKCQGKAPSNKQQELAQFAAGPALTPVDIEQQIAQMQAQNPNFSADLLNQIRTQLAASLATPLDLNNPQQAALYYLEANPIPGMSLTQPASINSQAFTVILSKYYTLPQSVVDGMRILLHLTPAVPGATALAPINSKRQQAGLTPLH